MARNFELNQIVALSLRSPELDIGAVVHFEDNIFEIFDPNLALIGKLDKIPVLRSLAILMQEVPDSVVSLENDTGIYRICEPVPPWPPVPFDCYVLVNGIKVRGIWKYFTTGNTQAKYLVQLFNDNVYNDPENPGAAFQFGGKKPNLLGIASRSIAFDKDVVTDNTYAYIEIENVNFNMQYQGGVPLKPRICIRNEIGVSNVVAGTKWARGGLAHCLIFMEIDWKTIGKAEFDEYIREYIYVQE